MDLPQKTTILAIPSTQIYFTIIILIFLSILMSHYIITITYFISFFILNIVLFLFYKYLVKFDNIQIFFRNAIFVNIFFYFTTYLIYFFNDNPFYISNVSTTSDNTTLSSLYYLNIIIIIVLFFSITAIYITYLKTFKKTGIFILIYPFICIIWGAIFPPILKYSYSRTFDANLYNTLYATPTTLTTLLRYFFVLFIFIICLMTAYSIFGGDKLFL